MRVALATMVSTILGSTVYLEHLTERFTPALHLCQVHTHTMTTHNPSTKGACCSAYCLAHHRSKGNMIMLQGLHYKNSKRNVEKDKDSLEER